MKKPGIFLYFELQKPPGYPEAFALEEDYIFSL